MEKDQNNNNGFDLNAHNNNGQNNGQVNLINNNHSSDHTVTNEKSMKDYLNLIRNNLGIISIIVITSIVISVIYAVSARNIYKSTTSLEVNKPKGNILETSFAPEMADFTKDRFISNEIEILKSYNLRERSASALLDSIKSNTNEKYFSLKSINQKTRKEEVISLSNLISLLNGVRVEQKRGLDIVEITFESPSPFEAALIVNTYAMQYRLFNLQINRDQLTIVKNFLNNQKTEKQQELNEAEDRLKSFQEQGGIVALDAQASNLVGELSTFEAKKNETQIEANASDKVLSSLKAELSKQDPKMNDYLKNLANESYLKTLQEQLAKLEVNRDLVLSGTSDKNNTKEIVKDLDKKIADLKSKLNSKIETVKASIFASSPEQVKDLTKRIIEEEIKNQSLKISAKELGGVVGSYEARFNQLPKTSIELAKYQRTRESLEKLYTLVEEKYQEALINEQSQPGNVLIIDEGRISEIPSKPNRMLIVLVGTILGLGISFGFVLVKNYFDNTIKSPEDLQKRNSNVLSWIPQIENVDGVKEFEFIVSKKPDSIPSEAFRALRTRVQFSSKALSSKIKTLLITSSAPQEGKTTVCVNLAGSFAQSNKKVLVIDCDLRKPRIHNLFQTSRRPGLVDYLYGECTLEEIIRPSDINNLFYIPSGTIPPNPAETLESKQMQDLFTELKSRYDLLLIDSPPIIAVTDSEILSNIVDASILVVSANSTEIELFEKSNEILGTSSAKYLGTVLNNFSYKSGYGSYYKYYYYYSRSSSSKTDKTQKV